MSLEDDYEATRKKLLGLLPEGETETDIVVLDEELPFNLLTDKEKQYVKTGEQEQVEEPLTEEEIKEIMKDERLTDEQIIEVKQKTLKTILEWPRNRGRKELAAYLGGEQLSARQSIIAYCYSCCGGYCDGTKDCYVEDCPLHDFMPYREGGRIIRRGKNKTEEEDDETETKEGTTE